MTSPYLHSPARSRRRRPSPPSPRRGPSWRRWLLVLIGLAVLFLAPALARSQDAPGDVVMLTWTAPGAEGAIGPAMRYDLREYDAPIDPTNWALARPIANVPLPHAPGTREFFLVTGLTAGPAHYFALRSRDEAGNWSPILGVARTDRPLDESGPVPPSGLLATFEHTWVQLHWTPSPSFHVLGYTVLRANAAAGPYVPLNPQPLAGADYQDTALPSGVDQVWYAVTATDQSHRVSSRCDSVLVEIGDAGAPVTWRMETGYPNPSRLSDRVTFPVIVPAHAADNGTLVITDNGGHRIWQSPLPGGGPGRTLLTWDGRNEDGRVVAPGVYRVFVISGFERTMSRIVRVP